MGGGMRAGGGASFRGAMNPGGGGFSGIRGAQANIGGPRVGSVSSGSFAGRGSGQFAQSGVQGNWQGGHGWRHHRGFGSGAGFVAGLAAGSALGYGYGPYYDDYAYNDYYDNGPTTYVVSGDVDPASCAQRYRSWDPVSQTYLGYDGLRHPCGE
jgi:hypothetical protein